MVLAVGSVLTQESRMRSDYRSWLQSQGYSLNTISTQCSYSLRAEEAYGDLDQHYASDRLMSVLESLRYSSADARRGAPNPAKVQISGDLYKSLASFRSAVGLYRRFRDENEEGGAPSAEVTTAPSPRTADPRERVGLERDLQKALRRQLGALEHGLVVIDDGVERAVSSGYIDITARDADRALVVIELKAGTADRAAIGQILSYMGDLAEEEPETPVRGILVAHNFDSKAKAAARMVPNLQLRSYAVRFDFVDPM
jgi:hypothetical protein